MTAQRLKTDGKLVPNFWVYTCCNCGVEVTYGPWSRKPDEFAKCSFCYGGGKDHREVKLRAPESEEEGR